MLVPSAALVAVTPTLVGDVTVGAVNEPLSEIVPPLADQMTAVSLVLVAVAMNCCFPPEERVTAEGESLILMWITVDLVVAPWDGQTPPQPDKTQAKAERRTAATLAGRLMNAVRRW